MDFICEVKKQKQTYWKDLPTVSAMFQWILVMGFIV